MRAAVHERLTPPPTALHSHYSSLTSRCCYICMTLLQPAGVVTLTLLLFDHQVAVEDHFKVRTSPNNIYFSSVADCISGISLL